MTTSSSVKANSLFGPFIFDSEENILKGDDSKSTSTKFFK